MADLVNESGISTLGKSMDSVRHLMNDIPNFSSRTEEGIETLSNSVKGLSGYNQALVLSQNNVNEASIRSVLATNGLTAAETEAAMAKIGHKAATQQLTIAESEEILTTQLGNKEKAIQATAEIAAIAGIENDVIATNKLTYAQLQNILAQKGMTSAQIAGYASALGLSKGVITLKMAVTGFLTVLKTLAPELIIFTLVASGFIALKKYVDSSTNAIEKQVEESKKRKETYQEEIKQAKELSQEYSNSAKTLDEYSKTYADLNKKTVLVTDDKNKLIDIQEKLIESYGIEAKGIDLVNGKYEDNIKLLDELSQKEKERARQNAQSVYYDAKNRNSRMQSESGGNYVLEEYTGTSKQFSDETYRKMLRFAEGAQLVNEAIFGDGTNTGSTTILSLNPELSNDELLHALDTTIKNLDEQFSKEEKASETWQNFYSMLLSTRQELIDKQSETQKALNTYAETTIASYTLNGISQGSVTEETYQMWHDGMIEQFAKDDPDLQKAIDEKLSSMFSWLDGGKSNTFSFDFATFYEENGLEDLEKLFGKIQTAYKNLEDGQSGFQLDGDILKQFPELTNYLNDTESLKKKLQEIANLQIEPLVTNLKGMQENLSPDSDDYKAISNTISWLEKQADVTTKVKEKTTKTSDLYKEQKKQIHENIQALNREIQSIDKQVDALEKKKEAQEEYVKQLEKEKDRLDDLIDKYERAADTVSDYIDEQIDGLEKQQDAIEKSYNDQIDALKEYYDEKSDLLSEQIKGLEFDSSSYDSQID